MVEPKSTVDQSSEPESVESEALTADQTEQSEPEAGSESEETETTATELVPTPLPELPASVEEISPEAEQAVYDKIAMRQAKQELAMRKASEKINAMMDNRPTDIERTDIDDLLSPTADSPEDEMERTDTDDVTGLSEKDRERILGTGMSGNKGDDDLSDLFEVTDDDVMYGGEHKPSRSPKSRKMKRTKKPRPEQTNGGLGQVRY